jgi:hypothetical protein
MNIVSSGYYRNERGKCMAGTDCRQLCKMQKTRIVSKPVTLTFGDPASDAQIDYFSRFGGKYVSD